MTKWDLLSSFVKLTLRLLPICHHRPSVAHFHSLRFIFISKIPQVLPKSKANSKLILQQWLRDTFYTHSFILCVMSLLVNIFGVFVTHFCDKISCCLKYKDAQICNIVNNSIRTVFLYWHKKHENVTVSKSVVWCQCVVWCWTFYIWVFAVCWHLCEAW